MQELAPAEIEEIGAGSLMSAIGTSIIGGVAALNDLFNTPIVSWVGQAADRIGFGLKEVHFAADAIGYAASKAVASLGAGLGGTGSVDYHFEKEWHSGPLLH